MGLALNGCTTKLATILTTTYLEVRVLLTLATLPMGTNGLASGKYAATLPRGMS